MDLLSFKFVGIPSPSLGTNHRFGNLRNTVKPSEVALLLAAPVVSPTPEIDRHRASNAVWIPRSSAAVLIKAGLSST